MFFYDFDIVILELDNCLFFCKNILNINYIQSYIYLIKLNIYTRLLACQIASVDQYYVYNNDFKKKYLYIFLNKKYF
jgi:hypothetical protein